MCEHENREAAMVVLARNDEGTPTVWCDPCIAPVVQALNEGGLRTIASCCGHDHNPGHVMLADGRTVFVANGEWTDRLSTAIHDIGGCKPGRECTACAAARDPHALQLLLDEREALHMKLARCEALAADLWTRPDDPNKSYLGGLYDAARGLIDALEDQ